VLLALLLALAAALPRAAAPAAAADAHTAWAWGFNGQGNLGDGTTSDSSRPVPIQSLSAGDPVSAIAASLALTQSGRVWACVLVQHELLHLTE
jgi:hypothetical protein